MRKKILFLSNGHGEDLIARTLIEELKKQAPDISISAMPIVGEGRALANLGIEIIGPRKPMPSGGFIYHNFMNLLKDLSSGLVTNTFSQISLLRTLKGKYDLVIAVGDIVVIFGAYLTGDPFVFVGCAKSDHYDYSYTPWEKWLLKNYAKLAFPRDLLTANNLQADGINAVYLGNPMMDGIHITGDLLGTDISSRVVGFLPGTREDVYLNIEDLVPVATKILEFNRTGRKVEFLIALAEGLDVLKAVELIPEDLPIKMIQGKFGDVLNRSEIIVGLSGTGNEQAAGLGKPVVCFPTRGVQHTKKFALDKKQLLGDALALVEADPSIVAQEVWNILNEPDRMEKMREAGKDRMGGRGAAEKIINSILNLK